MPKPADELRAVAETHAGSGAELGAAILARLRETVPEFFADDDVAYDMAAAVTANVERVQQLLTDAPSSDAQPIEAADLLQSTIQHGIPLISLLDAYRSAQGLALDFWQRRLDEEIAPQRRPAASRLLNHLIVGYIDAAAAQIRASYELQRTELESSRLGRHAHLIRRLLAGEALDVDAAARTLNHPLAAQHIGVVAWRTDEGEGSFDPTLAALAAAVGPARILTMPAARHRTYAWLSTTGALDVGALRSLALADGVQVATSGVHAGLDGFVRAHLDAVHTAGVVRDRPATGRVAVFEEFELVALLSRDPADRDRFVTRVLGPIAGDDAPARAARETLRAFLACGSSPSRTAARLGVHRNTVTYRIDALADQGVVVSLDDTARRLEVELALHVVDQLGSR